MLFIRCGDGAESWLVNCGFRVRWWEWWNGDMCDCCGDGTKSWCEWTIWSKKIRLLSWISYPWCLLQRTNMEFMKNTAEVIWQFSNFVVKLLFINCSYLFIYLFLLSYTILCFAVLCIVLLYALALDAHCVLNNYVLLPSIWKEHVRRRKSKLLVTWSFRFKWNND